MKRLVVLAMIVGLMAGSLVHAEAKAPKPTKVTMYLHGTEMLGEVDMGNNFGAAYNKMDTTKPDGAAPKSWGLSAWRGTPWNDCAGMFILPVWTSGLTGTVKGDIKISLYSINGPRAVEVQIWADVGSQACASNDTSTGTYPEPTVSTVVDLAPGAGLTEATIEDVNFKAHGIVMLQLRPTGPNPGRLLYDAADYASSIQFTCIPSSGRSCV
ncbi:MAG: hypothetical protein QOG04_1381 [Actinomycetota bacterium]|jgi:hypothetical protein|nr:hypothetical protein [Actinomycetota bacterium]